MERLYTLSEKRYMVRAAEAQIFQLNLNRTVAIDKPLQMIVSFKINKAENEIRVTPSI